MGHLVPVLMVFFLFYVFFLALNRDKNFIYKKNESLLLASLATGTIILCLCLSAWKNAIIAGGLITLVSLAIWRLWTRRIKVIIPHKRALIVTSFASGVGLFSLWFLDWTPLPAKFGFTTLIALVLLGVLLLRFVRLRAWILAGLVSFLTFSSVFSGLLITPPAMAADEAIAPGAYIIDMGQATQTIGNGLKPYGLIYELIVKKAIPVKWAINPNKARDGIDFTANGKSYKGSAFIIPAEFAAEAAASITAWKAQGVVVDGPTTAAFTAPIYETVTKFPNAVLDFQNGAITQAYYTNAGIPASTTGTFGSFTTYRYAYPSALTPCDDLFVMPHADPTWATHQNLIPFNQSKGFIWAACHAVSVLELVDSPADADTLPNMNFLSTNTGLINFGSHSGGIAPYNYATTGAGNPYGYAGNTNLWADPIMQFLGKIDDATNNGSEQIYLPKPSSAWRNTTTVAVYDADQANVVAGQSPGLAAKLAFGLGFGSSSNGMVMYEAGHSHAKATAPDNVAAQRAFFNFVLLTGIVRGLNVNFNIPDQIPAGSTVAASASVSGGTGGPYAYRWYSTCGGTFSNPTGATTNFTAPTTTGACNIRVLVSDACNRRSFGYDSTLITGPMVDLGIVKTDNQDKVSAGSAIAYTLTVTNNSPTTVSSVQITDKIPTTIQNPVFTPSTGSFSYNSTTGVGTWTGLTLAQGQPITLTLNGTVSSSATLGSSLTNTATIAPPSGFTDTNSSNDISTDTDTITAPQANLSITKQKNQSAVIDSSLISYTLTVSNAGLNTVNNLTIKEVMNDSLFDNSKTRFTPSTGTVTTSSSGSSTSYTWIVNWSGLNLATGQSVTLLVNSQIRNNKANQTLTNTATVDPPTNVIDPDLTNNKAEVSDIITSNNGMVRADLGITKSDGVTSAIAGQRVTYTITVTNKDNVTVNSLVLKDTLPTALLNPTFCTGTYDPNSNICTNPVGTYTASTGSWTGVSLPQNGSLKLTVSGIVDPSATGSLTNTATVSPVSGTSSGQTKNLYDDQAANNTAEDTDTLSRQVKLTISKTDNQTTASPGTPITYTIKVKNEGPSTVNSVRVADTVPSQILNPVFAVSTGTYNPTLSNGTWAGDWTNLTLKPGDEITLTVSGTVAANATTGTNNLTNTVTLSKPANENYELLSTSTLTASDTDSIEAVADLSITKTDDQTTAVPGEPIGYIITVTNKGPSTVGSVTVNDTVPSAILNPVFTATSGTYDPATGQWTGLNLGAGQSVVLLLEGTVSPTATGNLTNSVVVSPPTGVTDPNSNNNTNSDTDTLAPKADVNISKTDGKTAINPGDPITYTIRVGNNGPSTVNNIAVQDTVPSTINNVTWTCAVTTGTGSCGAASGSGNAIATTVNLTKGAIATYTVQGTVSPSAPKSGTLTNTAQISLPAGVTDPNPSNNSSTDTDSLSVPTGIVDLSITKTDNQTIASPGTPINYAITVTNNGPDTVDSVTVKDAIPAAILDAYFATPDGTYDSDTGEWTGLNLAPGASAMLILDGTVSASASGKLTNTATVEPPAGFTDSDLSNNSSTDEDTIPGATAPPELLLVKRITAVNGVAINGSVDDTYDNPDTPQNEGLADNNPKWPNSSNGISSYLKGVTNGGEVRPGDELEYTIYFLSSTDTPVTNASLCDLVPSNSTFIPNSFGSASGIDFAIGTTVSPLTNVVDSDSGEFFAPNQKPSATCSAANTNGAIVVRIVKSPATLPASPGSPGYGFIRFRAKVN